MCLKIRIMTIAPVRLTRTLVLLLIMVIRALSELKAAKVIDQENRYYILNNDPALVFIYLKKASRLFNHLRQISILYFLD